MGRIIDKKLKAMQDLEMAKDLPADAQYQLGLKYFRNSSACKDYSVAFELFRMAARNNHIKSLVYVARMYSEGLFIEENEEMAIKCLKKASSLGGINAMCILGSIAVSGQNPEVPAEDAVKYYTQAADLGSLYAKFCLGEIYKSGITVEKDYEKSIGYYSICIKAEPISKNIGILAESYLGLVQCYLELHYLEEANTIRNSAYYENLKQNKEMAKQYLEKAKSIKDLVSQRLKEKFENTIRIYECILNEDVVDLSKMAYGEFRDRFYNKHSRIFLSTKKSKYLIYNDGIRSYFSKRDDEAEELERALMQKEKLINKRKVLLKRFVENLQISQDVEEINLYLQEVEESMQKELTDFKQNYLVDYSSCVINLDKYLEEILHQIFVVELHNYKKEKSNLEICEQESLIVKLIKKMSLEKLKQFNHLVNGVNIETSTDKINKERHIELLNSFLNKLVSNKTQKSMNRRLENLTNLLKENSHKISENETAFVENVLKLNSMVESGAKLKFDQSFQLGALFDLTFVENYMDESSVKMSSVNKLKNEILDFVCYLNQNLTRDEIYLKLHELILKIEYFRVMIRNVASHKSILTRRSFEKGLNLCIVQESSIFNLLDELFGEYIEKQIYLSDIKNLLSELNPNDQCSQSLQSISLELLDEIDQTI